MIQLALVLVALFHLFSILVLYSYRKRNPIFLMVCFNWFFSTGTLLNLDSMNPADIERSFLLVIASLGIFIFSALMFNRARYRTTERIFASRLESPKNATSLGAMWLLLIISTVISFIYYRYLVGYNLFSLAISGYDLDFTTMRLEAYAGENYTGAGIVNQFKNTILPISMSSIAFVFANRGQYFKMSLFIMIVFPFFFWAILGTGQRTFLFFSMAGFLYSLTVMNRRTPPIIFIALSCFFIFGFAILSVSLGRSETLSFSSTFDEVIHRFFNSNQAGAVHGFRYVYTKETVYGQEWLETLSGFMPGVRGSTLSNEVFAEVFGGFRGTIPVSMWISIYYNFGIFLVIPVTCLIMKVAEMAHGLLRVIPASEIHLISYSFLAFYICLLPLTSPFQIINNGILGIALIFLLSGFQLRRGGLVFRLS